MPGNTLTALFRPYFCVMNYLGCIISLVKITFLGFEKIRVYVRKIKAGSQTEVSEVSWTWVNVSSCLISFWFVYLVAPVSLISVNRNNVSIQLDNWIKINSFSLNAYERIYYDTNINRSVFKLLPVCLFHLISWIARPIWTRLKLPNSWWYKKQLRLLFLKPVTIGNVCSELI